MFGVDAFELDHELGLRDMIDKDPVIGDTLAQNVAELHLYLVGRGLKERDRAENEYNKAIREETYDVGERVIIYSQQLDIKKKEAQTALAWPIHE